MPSEQAQKFIDWSKGHLYDDEISSRALTIIGGHAETSEGRSLLALSYIETARQRLQRAIQDTSEARRTCEAIESFINTFPVEERFTPPLITLRVVLITLYGFLSEQESVPDQTNHSSWIRRALRDAGIPVQAIFTSENGIVIEVPLSVPVSLVEGGTYRDVIFSRVEQEIPEPEPEYSGPRPTRFERLNEEENQ